MSAAASRATAHRQPSDSEARHAEALPGGPWRRDVIRRDVDVSGISLNVDREAGADAGDLDTDLGELGEDLCDALAEEVLFRLRCR